MNFCDFAVPYQEAEPKEGVDLFVVAEYSEEGEEIIGCSSLLNLVVRYFKKGSHFYEDIYEYVTDEKRQTQFERKITFESPGAIVPETGYYHLEMHDHVAKWVCDSTNVENSAYMYISSYDDPDGIWDSQDEEARVLWRKAFMKTFSNRSRYFEACDEALF